MFKKTMLLLVVLALLVPLTLTSCQPAAAPTEAPKPTDAPKAAEEPKPAEEPKAGEFNWRQFEGQKITVFLSETPMAVAIRSHLQEFKDLTGIDVDYLVVAENEYWSKLTIDLTSGAGQFNVFMSGPTLNWGYASANQIQPLDPYMQDASLTPADWDQDDFYPWSFEANRWDGTPGPAGLGQGELWAMPINAVNNLLVYRKDLLDQHGIKPPSTWDDWAAAARELKEKTGGTVDGKPFYAVAQRGALDTTTLSGPFYSGLFSYGGTDFNDDLTPAINSPKSVAFQELYMDTIKETGSPEWPNQMWFDVQQGFTSGQYGMVFDVGDFVPTYEGSGSAVAGKLGYAEPPAGPDGTRLSSVWTWGFSMNAATKDDQAKASWLFIMWASDKKNMTEFAKEGSWPTRVSVWNSPEVTEFANQFGNGAFREAFDKVLASEVEWLVAPMLDASAVEQFWVKGLQDYYYGKGTMQEIMDGVAKEMTQEMKDSGTLQ